MLFSLIVLGTLKPDGEVKPGEIWSVFALKDNSVTVRIEVLLDSISTIIL